MAVATESGHIASFFGIEAPKQILWKGWEPGGEYTKQLVIKNSNVKTQKLQFLVPTTRYFTTLYPKVITLSAGTSFTLPITFRPLEKNTYEDQIEFQSKEYRFKIAVKAIVIEPVLIAPKSQNFSMCAVNDARETTFELKNTSDLKTTFHWDISGPFTLEPAQGILEPKTSCTMHAAFHPKSAHCYNATAVCKYGPDFVKSRLVEFEGIGKYPHIVVNGPPGSLRSDNENEIIVNFGDVPVGTKQEKWIELRNLSSVPAPYHIMQPSKGDEIEIYYTCEKVGGVIPPDGVEKIQLVYYPKTVKERNIDYFSISVISSRATANVVKCEGNAIGSKIEIDNTLVSFGSTCVDQEVTRVITLINHSNVHGYYQFRIDDSNSVFKFSKTCGQLPPNHSEAIKIVFKPALTISYYRKVFLVVHNQETRAIELFGSSFTEQERPAVIHAKHVHRFRKLEERGLTIFPPEFLSEMLKEGKVSLDSEGAIMVKEAEAFEPYLRPYIPLTTQEEYFDLADNVEKIVSPHVSLDQQQVNFGSCPNIKSFEQRNITIANHTRGKICCCWITNIQNVFSITPDVTTIQPLKSASFVVTFKPNSPNQFYEAELECYAGYKSMREYRLVTDHTIMPPWCLTVTLSGHTFRSTVDTYLPRYKFENHELIFPTVSANEESYRTLLLSNAGSNPIDYEFLEEQLGLTTIIPRKGLLQKEYQILSLKLRPEENKIYKSTIKCKFNESEKHIQNLKVICAAEVPRIYLDNDGALYFKPTGLGTASTRNYAIKNVTKLPIRYQWRIHISDQEIVQVQPSTGIIYPNEVQNHKWTFVPKSEVKYMIKAYLKAHFEKDSHLESSQIQKSSFFVRIIGEGSVGDIEADPTEFDFGNVVVGSAASQNITISNSSKCNLLYQLSLEQSISGPYDQNYPSNDDIILDVDKMEGVIPARSMLNITATVRPKQRFQYQLIIRYKLLTPTSDGMNQTIECSNPILCQLKVIGIYPTVKIVDARCSSTSNISKVGLWKLFNLDSFNMTMSSDPSPAETMYSVVTRHSTRRRPPINTKAVLDFNFGSAPVDSPPGTAYLMLKNTGPVPTDWAFLFPTDFQLDLEFWAENGDYSRDELYDMHVMDNKLFTITPSKGNLQPDETQVVTFSYRHIMPNTDRLPVIFKVSKGREVLINFVGVTVEASAKYVHFPSNSHQFMAMPIGSITYPKQVYELYNGGGQTVNYELDLSPCDNLKMDNYHCNIFQCLNPTGQIAPGQRAQIEWVFSPIEAKTYSVDVPVHILGVETHLVTFYGVGYDQRFMGDSMPFTDQSHLTSVPPIQLVDIPDQLAYLSQERISFGNLPLYSNERRILFLINKSKHVVSYNWKLPTKTSHQTITINPPRGRLAAEESILVKVDFSSYTVPSFFEIDIPCEIIDETEMAIYQKKLKLWETKEEERKHTFTITENNLQEEGNGENEEHMNATESQNKMQTSNAAERIAKKYQALPPIKPFLQSDTRIMEKKGRSRQKTTKTDSHDPPKIPQPFILYLGLNARTHSLKDYQANFPGKITNFHMDRSIAGNYQKYLLDRSSAVDEENTWTTCLLEERDIVANAISDMVKNLIRDHDFIDVISNLYTEPVPYFKQLGHIQTSSVMDDRTDDGQIDAVGDNPITNQSDENNPTSTVDQKSPTPSTEEYQSLNRDEEVANNLIDDNKKSIIEIATEDCITDESIARIPEVSNLIESILENTVLNILTEASISEISLTNRPRVIALPPHAKH
ncbi:uncharacterized protein TRIADDRAFT_60400 [Trichoplax adhaerens]|uniref:Abnormal spindle-like microcephaly-associated protein ASH domain-containing protein n=1 Tax=Trichoplax adhaerens TaxID=10228 RepID=B3S844_TRIAD|nr:hypothetical protein TRIADDRAFT_60400 [Trichoplax adhaerens]EDV21132.1 hypothetical protein TRIADDRAFT_60400 [Trichoplax adhaerens]|eukprot:XP_002116462.1 hypothetical protein TRIADDRAFT_60400 [Trichoplax adhaerens]